ncbi:hypothetical protein QYM36_011758, partial [Artemia franciscana]
MVIEARLRGLLLSLQVIRLMIKSYNFVTEIENFSPEMLNLAEKFAEKPIVSENVERAFREKATLKDKAIFYVNVQKHFIAGIRHILNKSPLENDGFLEALRFLSPINMKDSRSIADIAAVAREIAIGASSDVTQAEWLLLRTENGPQRGDSKYAQLTKLLKAMLTLSPGSADVERGFSRSGRILGEDQALMSECIPDARLMVYDTLRLYGGKPERFGIVGKVSCVCWKNDLVVMGDVEGNVIVWDTKNGIYKRIEIQKSPVKKVMFDNEQAKRLAILTTNNLEIWDLSQSNLNLPQKDLLYGQCQWPMKYSVRVRDFDWLSSNALAMACSDGVIRVTDPSLKTNPSLLINYPGQLRSVGAIPWLLREFLKRWLIFRKYLGEDLSVVSSLEPSHISILNRFWDGIQDSTKKKLLSESTTLAEKAYLVSKLFGSVEEVDLWTLAFHYIKGQPQIDVNFDYLTDQQLSKSHMMEKLQLYESRRSNSEQTRRIARDFLMLGETGKAASLLLDISQSEPSFYQDHLL